MFIQACLNMNAHRELIGLAVFIVIGRRDRLGSGKAADGKRTSSQCLASSPAPLEARKTANRQASYTRA